MVLMDLLSAGFYLVDYFFTLGVNGLMRMLEIQNQDQIRPILEQVPVSTRSLPSLIMFAAASKCLLFLALNIFLSFTFTPAAWKICKENEEIVKTIRSIDIQKQQPVATTSSATHDVKVKVAHIDSENSLPEDPAPTSYDLQAPYNPHFKGSQSKRAKEEKTRF